MFISMDSGNSGSLQSSSGGDEEYDSSIRQDSSMVLPPQANNNFLHSSLGNITHFNPLSSTTKPQQQPSTSLLPHHHQQPTLYDPSPSLFLAFSQTSPIPNSTHTSSFLNLEPPGLVTPDPNLGNLTANITSLPSQSNLGAGSNQGQGQQPLTTPQATSGRNPKKRTRASRRAPTTVLTTDTSNFRAMVQEFTGIPSPPFSTSPYTRSRFDFFGSMGYNNPTNPLRPSPQKFIISPSNTTNANTSTNNISTTFNISPPSVAYQFGSTSDHLLNLQKQPLQTMLNMQNQMLSFQPLLQNPISPTTTHPLHPLGELGSLSHGLSAHLHSGNNTSWRDGAGSTEENGSQRGRPSFDGTSTCKLNFSAAASNSDHFQHEKGLETANVSSSRGEGTVDSWICPSD